MGSGSVCGPTGETRTRGGQGLHLQANEPLVGSSSPFGYSNLCQFSGCFFFFLRRGVRSYISTRSPQNSLATKGTVVGCCLHPQALPPITACNSEVLSPLGSGSGSGWAGLWLENHWASELKHHPSGCSWALQRRAGLLCGCLYRVRWSPARRNCCIWQEKGMGEVFFSGAQGSFLTTGSWRDGSGQKLLKTGGFSFPQGLYVSLGTLPAVTPTNPSS